MASGSHGEGGREAFRERRWLDAVEALSAADEADPLPPADLDLLAAAAYLCGRDGLSEEAWTRAYSSSVASAEWARAARCAFWLGITLMNLSQPAKAAGWLGRAERALEGDDRDCTERGWVMIPVGLQLHGHARFGEAADVFKAAEAIGVSFGDGDLVATARQCHGRMLLKLDEADRGLALLDEAMVAVTAGEVSPIPAGIIYCSVIEACQEILDVARAREWTRALTAWCDAQPDLVPYRGRCLIHRSEIMQLNGEWAGALQEAERACEQLAEPLQPQLGAALYQRAEMHRVRGEYDAAETSYRAANERGCSPEPGVALLWLAQGRTESAWRAIRHALDETADPVARSRVLLAFVEIALAADDVAAAQAVLNELVETVEQLDIPLLTGRAAAAGAGVSLAEGDADAALAACRGALSTWRDLDVPYESARGQVLAGLACRALGDEDTARLEFDTACRTFAKLGAAPDLARTRALAATTGKSSPGRLTPREIEVLRLVARGASNREIADELVIAERTVARHISNIFIKLGVSTRTAAAAFAFQHDLA